MKKMVTLKYVKGEGLHWYDVMFDGETLAECPGVTKSDALMSAYAYIRDNDDLALSEALVLANMTANGKPFSVVQYPDWQGGHQCDLAPQNPTLGAYEFLRWKGTPLEFATQLPKFDDYYDRPHEKPYTEEYSGMELLRAFVNS